MKPPIQSRPMPRTFMQEIVGRQWTPDAERRTAPDDLPGRDQPKGKGRRKKGAEGLVLRQLTTFAVSPRY